MDGDDQLVTVGTKQAVLDLTGEDGDSRRLAAGGKWKALNRLTYHTVFKFMQALKASADTGSFFVIVDSGEDGGDAAEVRCTLARYVVNGKVVNLQLMVFDTVATVKCRRANDKCFVYMEKNDSFRRVDTSTLCMKKGVCPNDAWEYLSLHPQAYSNVNDESVATLEEGSSFWSWSEIGMTR